VAHHSEMIAIMTSCMQKISRPMGAKRATQRDRKFGEMNGTIRCAHSIIL
jgi:hypothetical protein